MKMTGLSDTFRSCNSSVPAECRESRSDQQIPLFRSILAFSPGILVLPPEAKGGQLVYVSHGTDDETQPYRRTHDSFLPRLAALGYRVTFRPFKGGHGLPPEAQDEAVRLFLTGSTKL